MPTHKQRHSEAVTGRVFDQMVAARQAEKHTRHGHGLIGRMEETKQRMLRYELLDMQDPEDMQRYAIVHNDTERYEMKREKAASIRGASFVEWKIMVWYWEIGENLPLHKTKEELRADDAERLALFSKTDDLEDFELDFGLEDDELKFDA